MEKTNNDRIVNILISFAGLAFCIAACFVPAPECLLADESLSMMQLYKGTQMILYIAVPAALMALSFIVTVSGRIPVLAVLSAVAGGDVVLHRLSVKRHRRRKGKGAVQQGHQLL